jgi:hypothetical protein
MIDRIRQIKIIKLIFFADAVGAIALSETDYFRFAAPNTSVFLGGKTRA